MTGCLYNAVQLQPPQRWEWHRTQAYIFWHVFPPSDMPTTMSCSDASLHRLSLMHTRAVRTDRGKATRVWVLHDSRQGRSLLANMEKSCSFCEAGCRTDFSCVVTCWRDSFLPQLLFLFRLMDEAQTYLTGKVNSWGVKAKECVEGIRVRVCWGWGVS